MRQQHAHEHKERPIDTYFARPERATADVVRRQVETLVDNPVVDGILASAAGVVAVLNEHRQILAVNRAFLADLGVEDPEGVLGLRPGEAIGCAHADDMPGRCGTSRHCASCGAAIAIVSSQQAGAPCERQCVATVTREGQPVEICLRVLATPVELEGRRLTVLLLQDVTAPERRAALERIFLHDIANVATALQGCSDLVPGSTDDEREALLERARMLSGRLADEIALQRAILGSADVEYRPAIEGIPIDGIIGELQALVAQHPSAAGKRLALTAAPAGARVHTDRSALRRVLTNMLTNAFEATEAGGEVRLWVEEDGGTAFSVWNAAAIPDAIALRVFQRHFSTKPGAGRGFGTFAMKLLAERVLKGSVSFSTSPEAGTVFRLALPLRQG